MKQIKVNLSDYVEAPIDDKNVLSDSIVESLFDDGNYVWEKNEAMGFVCGYPTYINYYNNKAIIGEIGSHFINTHSDDTWAKSVISRIIGEDFNGSDIWRSDRMFIDDERQFIFSFSVSVALGNVHVEFYYNQKKQ